MPIFSVVVPAYNAASTLRETLEAVLVQTCEDWELIVVDDGSTDETLPIAEEYAARDARVRVLSQENKGSAGAYNSGVAAATGDFVTICSADDLLMPRHLSEMSAFAEACPDYEIYSSNGYFLYEDRSQELVYDGEDWAHERSLSLASVIDACFFSVGATYRRDLFRLTGGYRSEIYGEDYDFWLRAMARGARHRYTPSASAVHRLSSGQKSAAVCRVCESNVRIIADLAESGLLSDDELVHAREAIALHQDRARHGGLTLEELTAIENERQARAFRSFVTRLVGSEHSDSVIDAAHRATWMARPFRIAANRVAVWIRRGPRKR